MLMGPSFRFRRLVVAVAVAVAVMISAATGAFFTFAEENGVPEKPTGLVTLAGDTQVQLSWENPKDTTVSKYQLWQLAQSAKLTADITKDNRFGYSVAVDVDTAVIGVPGDGSTAVTEAGAAYVFTRNTGTGVWSQAAKLTASDRASNDEFGISVAVDGETVVVGAHQHDIGTNSAAGAAYVYTKPGGGWAGNITETAKLTASDRASDDEFGISVAADGGTVVVGAAGVDGTDAGGAAVTEAGAAYVFTLNTDTGVWSQPAKLTASDRASDDEFGISVAVDGGNRRGWGRRGRWH